MATDLGKITITMNGDFDEITEYERLSCVRYLRSSWISTQKTKGNVPGDDSEFWQKITDDGHTMTIVKYNVVVPIEEWIESTEYEEYGYEAKLNIDGITAASICSIIFDLKDITGNNLAPVCNSFYGGVIIYAKKQPKSVITISSVLANKYYDQDDFINDSVKDSIAADVDDLSDKLNTITDNVIDVQSSTIFLRDIVIPSASWIYRSQTNTTDGYAVTAEVKMENMNFPGNFEEDYVATVIFNEQEAISQIYSPVVVTLNSGNTTMGNQNTKVIRLFGKQGATENTITIPVIKLERISKTTLNNSNTSFDNTVSD